MLSCFHFSFWFWITIFYGVYTVKCFGIRQQYEWSTHIFILQNFHEWTCSHWSLEFSWLRRLCWASNSWIKVSIDVKYNKTIQKSAAFISLSVFSSLFVLVVSFVFFMYSAMFVKLASTIFLIYIYCSTGSRWILFFFW